MLDLPIGSCIDCDFETFKKKFHVRYAIKAGINLAQKYQYIRAQNRGLGMKNIF
jgi:hypothetical protein